MIDKKPTEEIKQKLRDNNAHYWKDKPRPEETRKKISVKLTGTKRSPLTKETREKISKGNKGKTAWNKGLTKETDERVKRGAESNVGKKRKKSKKIKTNCTYCGKEIWRTPYRLALHKNTFCDLNCCYKWMVGQKRTDEQRKRMSESSPKYWKDKKFEKEHRKNISKGNKNKIRTLETRIKYSMSRTGEKEFTGFRMPLNVQIRKLTEYVNWRKKVFKRDDYTCNVCGSQYKKYISTNLNAHHIIFLYEIIKKYSIDTIEKAKDCSELWDINNGITLCVKCHKELHKKR